MLVIRFPDGDAQFHSAPAMPSIGDRIQKRDAYWRVARVDANTQDLIAVTVMPWLEVVRDESWPEPYQFIRA